MKLRMFPVSFVCVIIVSLVFSSDIHAKRKKKPSIPPACKTDRSVYAYNGEVTVTPLLVQDGQKMFWMDGYDRLLREFSCGSDRKPFSFKLDSPTSRQNHIVVTDSSGKITARTSFWVMPDIDYWTGYEVWMYGGHEKYRGPKYEQMRACNVNGSMCYMDTNGTPYARNDLRYYVEFCIPKRKFQNTAFKQNFWPKFMGPHRAGTFDPEKKYFYRPHCLNDPAFIKYSVKQMTRHLKSHRKFRHGAYSISDEPSVTAFSNPFDYCYSPHCMKKFREWLKKKYKSLEALNRQWDTDFKNWDTVVPDSTNETKARNNPEFRDLLEKRIGNVQIRERNLFLDEMIKPGSENFSSWSDHREFMDLTFCTYLRRLTEKTRELDPHSPAGILGTQMPSAFGGWDFYQLSTAIDWFEAYDMGNSWEFIRSFRKPRTVVSRTTFTRNVSTQRWQVNSYFLKGGQGGILFWGKHIWKDRKNKPPVLKTPVLPSMRRTWGYLHSGITHLRQMAEPCDHPIGIYYNQASRRASWLIDSELDGTTWPRRFTSWDSARSSILQADTGVMRVLEDNGYQYKVLDGRQVEDGILLKQKYKVLIMPRIVCLSEKEANEIEKFVNEGGVLVTDGALGTMDPQCRRRKNGALDTLCGVTRQNFRVCERDGGYFRWNKNILKTTDPGKEKDTAEKMLRNVDVSLLFVSSPGLRADGGQPLAAAGETPALILNRHGKGLAICTNLYFADYAKKRGDRELSSPLLNLFRNILELAEVRPHYDLYERTEDKAAAQGAEPRQIEQYYFRLGSAEYAAFNIQGKIRQDALGNITVSGVRPGLLYPLSVKLHKKQHVYNARSGEYCGKTDLVPVNLDPYAFCWLSLMPYRVKTIDIDIHPDREDPLLISYTAEISGADGTADHVIHLSVTDPDGNVCDYHSTNIIAHKGKGKGVLRIAGNGKAGTWTLRFKDAATGVTAEASYVKEDAFENAKIPVYNAIQDGRLYGHIKGPFSLRETDGRLEAVMWVRLWSEGLREPRGTISISVNEPWKPDRSEFSIEEVNRQFDGDFGVRITCPKDSNWREKGIQMTARRETADGRKHTAKSKKIPGKSLHKKLNPKVPIRIRFNQYYEDMVRMNVDGEKLVYRIPMEFQRRAGSAVPEGVITATVSEGWKISPAELDLRKTLLQARGEAEYVVEGIPAFKAPPRVTIAVKSPQGVNAEVSRVLEIHYAKPAEQAPVLDGTLNEECWKDAYLTTIYHPHKMTSEFRVTYTGDTVYFAIQAKGLDPANVKARPPKNAKKDEGLWNEEFFELLIDPTQRMGKIPYQFAMNYKGRSLDRIGELGRSWTAPWEIKGAKAEDGYILEIAVPFSSLDTDRPEPYEIWGINPYRNDFPPNKRFSHDWNPFGNERASNFFGRLFFLPDK